jgi:hypothetical protein
MTATIMASTHVNLSIITASIPATVPFFTKYIFKRKENRTKPILPLNTPDFSGVVLSNNCPCAGNNGDRVRTVTTLAVGKDFSTATTNSEISKSMQPISIELFKTSKGVCPYASKGGDVLVETASLRSYSTAVETLESNGDVELGDIENDGEFSAKKKGTGTT